MQYLWIIDYQIRRQKERCREKMTKRQHLIDQPYLLINSSAKSTNSVLPINRGVR